MFPQAAFRSIAGHGWNCRYDWIACIHARCVLLLLAIFRPHAYWSPACHHFFLLNFIFINGGSLSLIILLWMTSCIHNSITTHITSLPTSFLQEPPKPLPFNDPHPKFSCTDFFCCCVAVSPLLRPHYGFYLVRIALRLVLAPKFTQGVSDWNRIFSQKQVSEIEWGENPREPWISGTKVVRHWYCQCRL